MVDSGVAACAKSLGTLGAAIPRHGHHGVARRADELVAHWGMQLSREAAKTLEQLRVEE